MMTNRADLRSPGLLGKLGFNGEQSDPFTGHYLLGNGYRAFNTVLMRFNSPDSLSPFGRGGLNTYAYCVGDPVNWSDPTGHMRNPFSGLASRHSRTPRSTSAPVVSDSIAHPTQTAPVATVSAGRQPPQYAEIDPNRSPPPPYFESAPPPQPDVDNSRPRLRLESQLRDLQIQLDDVHPSQRAEVGQSIAYVESRLVRLSLAGQQNDAIRAGTTMQTPAFSLVRPPFNQEP